MLAHSVTKTNNSLKTDKIYDCNPYLVCIVFITLTHCTLCSDCSHIFVSFQTVVCFCQSELALQDPPCLHSFFSPKQPYIFYHYKKSESAVAPM